MALSKLKRIEPLSAALTIGLINTIIGLIMGILAAANLNAFFASTGTEGSMVQNMVSTAGAGALARVTVIVVYPVMGFITGFISTLVVAWLYNLIAKKMPLKIELK